jgi:hypothetical protein
MNKCLICKNKIPSGLVSSNICYDCLLGLENQVKASNYDSYHHNKNT